MFRWPAQAGGRTDAMRANSERHNSKASASGVEHDAVVHALVVFRAPGRVGQDLIGLGDGLEARFRARGLVAVRVIAHRERAVDLLDVVVGRHSARRRGSRINFPLGTLRPCAEKTESRDYPIESANLADRLSEDAPPRYADAPHAASVRFDSHSGPDGVFYGKMPRHIIPFPKQFHEQRQEQLRRPPRPPISCAPSSNPTSPPAPTRAPACRP